MNFSKYNYHPHYSQSEAQSEYLAYLGWKTERIKTKQGTVYVYLRHLPLLGWCIKVPRIIAPVPQKELDAIRQEYNAKLLRLEPGLIVPESEQGRIAFEEYYCQLGYGKTDITCELATAVVDLTKSEAELLQLFPRENTRRNVRNALRQKLKAVIDDDIETFYGLHKALGSTKSFYTLPKGELEALFRAFQRHADAKILTIRAKNNTPLVAIFLLFYKETAYYKWVGSVPEAIPYNAASYAVWQSLLYAKEKGYQYFDFCGVTDDRKLNKRFIGYSHFKQGFTNQIVRFMPPVAQYFGISGNFLKLFDKTA